MCIEQIKDLDLNDAKAVWLAICEEAECVILPGDMGGKRLLLTEDMCILLGSALGA